MPTTSVPEGVAKYLLIDGQQRLTTIYILLALIRDKAKDQGDDKLGNEIEQTLLVNPFKEDTDHFKLLPTQIDRLAFQAVIQRNQFEEESQIVKAYRFFEKRLTQKNIVPISKVITGRLSVVSIVLDKDDNAHLVFESLNAKGQRLTQSDLIRNYFFMKIHIDKQEEIYAKYWQPMQQALQGDNLTECIRHYMMRSGSFVKQGDVYFTLKDRLGSRDAINALEEIAVFAGYYAKLLSPEKETNAKLRNPLERLNRLEVTTAYPFLLNCYSDYNNGQLSVDEFVQILQILENYVIRRFVCNIPTNQFNKIFPFLYDWSKTKNPSDFVSGVRSDLQTRDYPKDAEFRSRLVESRLYGGGESAVKTKLILETLEAKYGHKEQVAYTSLTIEHVMPQTLSEAWQHHLGEDWQADHELYLHVLGNLTLTAYNSELSNNSFLEKQKNLAQSHVELNRYFQKLTQWNRPAIEERGKVLADLALEAWPYFGEIQQPSALANADMATGRNPKILKILGERVKVDSWRDVHKKTLNTIADLEPELFEKLAKDYPRFISLEAERFRRNYTLNNGYYIDVNLNAKDVYRFCEQAIESIGLSREDWIVETD